MVLLKFLYLFIAISKYLKSTFHYGSIKISKFSTVLLNTVTSTFHYGSIKIGDKFSFIKDDV